MILQRLISDDASLAFVSKDSKKYTDLLVLMNLPKAALRLARAKDPVSFCSSARPLDIRLRPTPQAIMVIGGSPDILSSVATLTQRAARQAAARASPSTFCLIGGCALGL